VTKIKRTTLLVLLGACLAAAGCGSDDEGEPIPAESAALLQSQLDNIEARIQNGSVGACEDVLGGPRDPNTEPVEQAISDLPDNVSEDVRSGLQDGFDRLFTLVEERCADLREQAESQQEPAEPEPEPEPAPPPETVTVPPPETETETETTPPPETETTPSPETETLPPAEEPSEEESDGDSGGGAGTGAGGVIAPEGDEG
jgi:outer membrane biosynthesis protein TonB